MEHVASYLGLAGVCGGIAVAAWRLHGRRLRRAEAARALESHMVEGIAALRQSLREELPDEDEDGPLIDAEPLSGALTHQAAPPVLHCAAFGLGFGAKIVLDDLSFTVPAQGVCVLMGPPGTGKSTLLRALAGLYAENALYKNWGEVFYQGLKLGATKPPVLVAPRPDLLRRSVLESLLFHRDSSLPAAARRGWAAGWVREMGMEALIPLFDQPLLELPPGLRRATMILREAAGGPKLLMLDEPTSAMSDADAQMLLGLLRRLGARGALLVVLQSQKQAREIADSLVLLAGGDRQAAGRVRGHYHRPPQPAGGGLEAGAALTLSGTAAQPSATAPRFSSPPLSGAG